MRLLIVEDMDTDAEMALAELRRAGVEVEWRRVQTEDDFVAALDTFAPDLVLSDYSLPQFTGMDALRLARERVPGTPFIVYTGSLNEETAVACMKAGAWDYILKERMSRLPSAVTGALDLARTRRERERAREELRVSDDHLRDERALLRTLIDSIPDIIFFKDAQGRFLGCNQAFLRHSGLNESEVLGRTDHEVSPLMAADEFTAVDREVLASGRTWRGEVVGVYPGVLDMTFDTVKTPFLGPDGTPLGLIGVSRDITERKKIEAQMRLWADAFTSCAHGIALGNPETNRIMVCNPAFARLLGRTVEEVGGMPIVEVYAPEVRPHLLASITEADRAGQVTYEALLLRADGGTVPVQMDLVSVRGPDGGVRYRVATAQDITARRRAEASLSESEARYRGLVETSYDWIWEVDAEGRYTFASPRVSEILGYAPEEVLGRTPFDFMPDDEAARVGEKFAAIVARKKPFDYLENVNRHRDGRLVVLETSGVPVLGPDGGLRGYRGTDRDITERRRISERLSQSQKMEAVGRLAGGIAHDFNNLLQAMMSQAAVLRHRAGAPGGGDPLGEMEQLVTRGAGLTRQLLLFSRRETTVPVRLDVNEVVRGAATLLRRLVRADVAIVVELSAGELPVLADRGQLDQVLMNLAVNAADAIAGAGTITLRSGGLGGEVWFSVADTGPGIPAHVLPHLFEPFFTTKPAGKGTGLGLAVVHGIVTAHGGRIEAGAGDGGGALFTVWLPRAAAAEAPREQQVPAEDGMPRGAGQRVLVVEDEDGAREALATLLEILGYAVTAVGSGEAARALPEEPAFDLLLSDLVLPGVSGHELAAELSLRWPELEVVLMSGYTEDEVARIAVAGMGRRFLQKPFDTATLAGAIRAALAAASP